MKDKKIGKKIELLCPAGDLERLKTAVVFGADAVYCGLSDFSLRAARELNFTLETLQEGIEFAHKHGARVYLTFNIFPHEGQVQEIIKALKHINKKIKGVDGVIISDLGMFSLVKEYLPDAEIHISTQANTLNTEAVKMWGGLGAKRIVTARELTLGEIKEIINKLNGPSTGSGRSRITEIEVFGHGAMCMAYSGRCLLSKYFTGREANLGECAQSCRWRYKVKSQITNNKLQTNPKSQIQNDNVTMHQYNNKYFLEEETRPGDLLEIQEDEKGTYFLNSKDLCCLDILDQFIESGISSLKIEGRTKSAFYVAVATYVYRRAIDKYYELLQIKTNSNEFKKEWNKLIKELMKELNQIQNRGYSHGFLLGRDDYEQEYNFAAIRPTIIPLGQVLQVESYKVHKVKSSGVASPRYLVDVMNKFKVGEKLELMTPSGVYPVKVLEIETEKGEKLEEILKPKEKVWLELSGVEKVKISEMSFLRRKIKQK